MSWSHGKRYQDLPTYTCSRSDVEMPGNEAIGISCSSVKKIPSVLLSFCSCPCTSVPLPVPLPVPLSLSLPRFGNETIYKTRLIIGGAKNAVWKRNYKISVAHTNGVRKSLTNEISVSQVWFWPYEDWQLFTCIKALVYWTKLFLQPRSNFRAPYWINTCLGMLTDTSGYSCHTFMVSTLPRNAHDTSDCYCGL